MVDVQWTTPDGPVIVIVNAHSMILSRNDLIDLAAKASIAAEELAYDDRVQQTEQMT